MRTRDSSPRLLHAARRGSNIMYPQHRACVCMYAPPTARFPSRARAVTSPSTPTSHSTSSPRDHPHGSTSHKYPSILTSHSGQGMATRTHPPHQLRGRRRNYTISLSACRHQHVTCFASAQRPAPNQETYRDQIRAVTRRGDLSHTARSECETQGVGGWACEPEGDMVGCLERQ